jgi:hypothetical protein
VCFFVTVELPDSSVTPPEGYVLHDCLHPLEPRRGGQLVDVTDGHCSCDAVRGPKTDEGRIATKYRKKGWSDAKIMRAIESRRSKDPHRAAEILESWLAELAMRFGSVSVFIHWASSPLHPAASHPPVPVDGLGKVPLPTEGWFEVVSTA